MIEVYRLSKSYYGFDIIKNLNLKINKGLVFGFLGPNGAGKTTTIKMLVGLNKPDSGFIKIDKNNPMVPKTRQKIGFMPENPYFYDHLTGLELLKFCDNLSSPLFSQRARKTQSEEKSCTETEKKLSHNDRYIQILTDIGLFEAKDRMIRTYSKGMKQRLGLAQAIIHQPDYIFLDEPLDGLDPIGRIEIKKIIEELKKQGKTIFFNSHILADVEEICDEIGIIDKGRLIYSGNIKKFRGNMTLEEAFVNTIEESQS